jgi:hypothetical protein
MKKLILAAILFPSLLLAQSPSPVLVPGPGATVHVTPPSDALPDNYQLTLTITGKDTEPVEVSVTVASPTFLTAVAEQDLTFGGTVAVEESGAIFVTYSLGWQVAIVQPKNPLQQYKSSNVQGSVRLKLGEEVQIIRAGARTARLSIKKLEPPKGK